MNKDQEELPLVSILMPLYNEQSFIRETLQGVLAQQYKNIEILIADNNSTDSTVAICRELTQTISRKVFYFEHKTNIGAPKNHAFLFSKAKGDLVIFTSGHDKWSDNYLIENVYSLLDNKKAVLSYGTPNWIDQNGQRFNKHSGWYDTRGLSSLTRFFTVFWGKPNPILGLIKRECLPDLEQYDYVGADMVLLCDLALKGEFVHTINSTFYRRQNRAEESHNQRLKRYRNKDIQIGSSFLEKFFPLLRLPFALCKTILKSSHPKLQKLILIILLLVTMPIKYFSERRTNK